MSKQLDPLERALKILESHDPIVRDAQKQIWRKLWVRDTINDWIDKLEKDPGFFAFLHKALPSEIELLNEIRSVATHSKKLMPASAIVGLVNERLNRYLQAANAFPTNSSSLAVAEDAQCGKHSYSGFICAEFIGRGGRWNARPLGLIQKATAIPLGRNVSLSIWIQPRRPLAGWHDDILVEARRVANKVTFGFELDCATLRVPYGRKSICFSPSAPSDRVSFEFPIVGRFKDHVIYLQIFQADVLVKTSFITVKIARS